MNALQKLPRLPRGLFARLALLAALLAAPWAAAQEADAADPPARVGSISALRGPVEFSAQAGAAWDAARVNQPVTGQGALWAPPGSQAEVRIGSTSVRLDGNTQAVFSQLDDHGVALDMTQGTVRARLRALSAGDAFSLAVDGVRADAQMPGDYRADYDPDRRLLTVRAVSGRMRVVTPTGGVDVQTGQEVQVQSGGDDPQLHAMGPRDEFDHWAEARDAEQDRLASLRYVSPEMTGAESLDAYGRWEVSPDYGPIWYPSGVVTGWAPYRYGHWAWLAPWGWTWVDDAPWGFAPFHYGRWARVGPRWGWVPGPMVARPIYAPALVGYVGGQPSGVSVSIGYSSGAPVGWFPLAPGETYSPYYRHSTAYVRQINDPHWRHRGKWRGRGDHDHHDDHDDHDDHDRDHDRDRDRDDDRRMSTQPPGGFRYARQAEAVTVAKADDFRGSRRIGQDRIALTQRQAEQLQPIAARLQDDDAPRRPTGTPAREHDRDDRVATAPVATLPPPPARTQDRDDDRGRRGRAGTPAATATRPATAAPATRTDRPVATPPRAADASRRSTERDQEAPRGVPRPATPVERADAPPAPRRDASDRPEAAGQRGAAAAPHPDRPERNARPATPGVGMPEGERGDVVRRGAPPVAATPRPPVPMAPPGATPGGRPDTQAGRPGGEAARSGGQDARPARSTAPAPARETDPAPPGRNTDRTPPGRAGGRKDADAGVPARAPAAQATSPRPPSAEPPDRRQALERPVAPREALQRAQAARRLTLERQQAAQPHALQQQAAQQRATQAARQDSAERDPAGGRGRPEPMDRRQAQQGESGRGGRFERQER